MAVRFDAKGLLDLAAAKSGKLAKLPKQLATFQAEPSTPGEKLFPQLPVLEDLKALVKANPVDPFLYASLAAMLGGLSSGPGLVMGLLRAVSDDEVVVRLFLPKRPQPNQKPEPLYFQVKRGHGALAIANKWVGPKAPPWLALLAAVYYSYIKDRKAYYERKDLGGADNAAFLLLYGKDSSKADYGDEAARGGAATTRKPGDSSAAAKGILDKILGLPDGKPDAEFCAEYVFGESKAGGRRTKEWLAWIKQFAIKPATGLRGSLTQESVSKRKEFRKWLQEKPGLSAEAKSRLLLCLESNGVLSADEKERYSASVLAVWNQIEKALAARSSVALELRPDDPDRALLTDKDSCVAEVVALAQRDLPTGDKRPNRALRYLLLQTRQSRPGGDRKFAWVVKDDVQVLTEVPGAKAQYWMELDVALSRGVRVLGGASAIAVLEPVAAAESFETDLRVLERKQR